MPREPGLRERKKRETRRRIEEAAFELFETVGFEATTVDAIAAAADISPRTFFHYFPTKEDVVLADYSDRLDRIVEELDSRPEEEPPWEALEASFMVVAADYDAQRDLLARRFRIMARAPSVYARSLQLQSGWEDAVARVLARRSKGEPEDLQPRLMASVALSAMRSSQRHWMATGQEVHLPVLVRRCFEMLGNGLGSIG